MRRLLLAAVAALAVLPATAGACSCIAPGDPRQELAEADAAAFGKVVDREVVKRGGGFGTVTRYRVRVLRDYKDNLGEHFSFRSTADGAACGIEFARGDRFGTLLYRFRGGFSVGLCTVRSRAHLEAAARPLPEPSSDEPVALVLGGPFGDARVAGFDAAGGLVAYGRGKGEVGALAACPGGMTTLEVAGGRVYRRSVAALGTARELANLKDSVRSLSCLSPDGSRAAALLGNRVVRIAEGKVTHLGRVNGGRALLAGDRVWTQNKTIDVATGETQPFGPVRRSSIVALSPDGTSLLAARRDRSVVVDAKTGRVKASIDELLYDGVWLTDESLFAYGLEGPPRFYDAQLRERGRAPRSYGAFGADAGQLVMVIEDRLVRFDDRGRQLGSTPVFTTLVSALCATRSPAAAARALVR